MKKKTKSKSSNKYIRLFNKYSKTDHSTQTQIKTLLQTAFKSVYTKTIIHKFINKTLYIKFF